MSLTNNEIKNKACEKTVYSGSGFYSHKCNKHAKVEFEGKYYCGIHDPIKKHERYEIKQKLWNKEMEIRREAWHREELMKKILGDKTTQELEEMAKNIKQGE